MSGIAGLQDDSVAMMTARELRALVGKLRRKLLEQASAGDFTPSQISALSRLFTEGPATLTALAEAEGMRPQSMSAIVAVLESAGYVSGSADPSDGRRTILAVTDHARDTVYADRAAKEDWLFRSISSKLSPPEQVELANGVRLLQRLLEP